MSIDFTGKTALVVDDYHSMRVALKELLLSYNLRIIEAQNGLEGLEIIRKKKPDMVFTDIVMPVMDGLELCQEIKSDPELLNIPVVVLSTHSDAAYILKAIHNGADDYLPKPIEPGLLTKVLSRITDG
ncbi:MAG: response regulator [Nitrospinota bacterium]|nr:response regulator [Nitrospinota bacterium]MDH5755407.1 response regulator [Nitrospinota bacterium]